MSKIHELFKFNNDDLLDNEQHLDINEKQRILNKTLEKIPSKNNKKVNKRKLLVGILVATLMISTVAMASEHFEFDFDNYFKNSLNIDKNNTNLNGAGVNLNKSTTKNDLTVTLTQTLGDKHSLYILIDVIAPTDIINLESPTFDFTSIQLDKISSSGYSFECLNDNNTKDNKYRFLVKYNSEANLSGQTINLNLKNFGYFSEKTSSFKPLVKGDWKLSWKLDYNDVSKEFKVYRFAKENNYKSIITSINVSPISISANLLGFGYDNFEISSITMKDGSIYSTTSDNSKNNLFNGSSSSTSNFKSYTSVDFTKVIDINNIESVTIGKEIIKLNNKK